MCMHRRNVNITLYRRHQYQLGPCNFLLASVHTFKRIDLLLFHTLYFSQERKSNFYFESGHQNTSIWKPGHVMFTLRRCITPTKDACSLLKAVSAKDASSKFAALSSVMVTATRLLKKLLVLKAQNNQPNKSKVMFLNSCFIINLHCFWQ
jgi:hypothetical protein